MTEQTAMGIHRHAWLRFMCNDTDCPGALLLNKDDVLLAAAPPTMPTGRL